MIDTEAYQMQVLDDGDGRRVRIDGPHYLNMFSPRGVTAAVSILQAGHICWVKAEDVGAVAAALGVGKDGEHARQSGEGVSLSAMPGQSGAA